MSFYWLISSYVIKSSKFKKLFPDCAHTALAWIVEDYVESYTKYAIHDNEINCTILIPKGNSYCRRKSSAKGPWFKVSSEGLFIAEIDIPLRSPIQVQTEANVVLTKCTRQLAVAECQ